MAGSLDKIDKLIRAGQGETAAKELIPILESKLSRPDKVRAASLARRLNFHTEAVKILNPLVRPVGKQDLVATPEEIAEYAANLCYIGAHEESIHLLQNLDADSIPSVHLFYAFASFSRWDYKSAIPHLESYVKIDHEDIYWKNVGNVNLAAALVYEREHVKADYLLSTLIKETSLAKSLFLYGNCLELCAQNFLFMGKWAESEKFVKKAEEILSSTGTWYAFHARKWRAILKLFQNGKNSLKDLDEIRAEAIQKEHWETLRDCDRFHSICLKDKELAIRLYYGTPYVHFRDRLLTETQLTENDIPKSFEYRIGNGGESDIFEYQKEAGIQQLPKKLFDCLCADFYRPLRVATLHHQLYPDEFYNPRSAPKKIHEAVRRLRKILKEQQAPVSIQEGNGAYRLDAERACSIKITLPGEFSGEDARIIELRTKLQSKEFSAREAATILKVSPRTIARWMEEAKSRGEVTVSGRGRTTRYRFAS